MELYVATVDYQGDRHRTFAFTRRKDAVHAVAEYCRGEWNDMSQTQDEDMPDDDDEVIGRYFELVDDEVWAVDTADKVGENVQNFLDGKTTQTNTCQKCGKDLLPYQPVRIVGDQREHDNCPV